MRPSVGQRPTLSVANDPFFGAGTLGIAQPCNYYIHHYHTKPNLSQPHNPVNHLP